MQADSCKAIIKPTLLSFIFILFVCFICYQFVDRTLTFWLQQQTHILPRLSALMATYTSPIYWLLLAFLSLVLFVFMNYYRLGSSTLRQHCLLLSLSIIMAYVTTGVIKVILARYRPQLLFSQHLYGFHFFSTQHRFNSMPSGHAALTFAALMIVVKTIDKKWITLLLISLAIIIGLFRVYALAHYLSDVILGGYIGIMSSYYATFALNCYTKRRLAKLN